MRAAIETEKLGYPSASVVCNGFVVQARATAAGSEMRNLPLAVYPGHVNLHSKEDLQKNAMTVVADQVITGLTAQPEKEKRAAEPEPKEIVFSGTFEEVNEFFYKKKWSDGLPIIPPTLEKVEAFLGFTGHPADEVIGVLLPDKRAATTWNIAINGVMAGCRPEYMPLLVAIVQVMADPKFGAEHLGATPGTEALITVNGPIVKELGFNYEQGALRVGFQANTSIGRFWRLYLGNVAGFLPHETDKGSFGGTWRVVLAENEDAVAKAGWEPMSVDMGFQRGDNVVTVSSCTSTDSTFSLAAGPGGAATAETIMDKLAARTVDTQLHLFRLCSRGPSIRPQVLISPNVAEFIARAGYSKAKMKRYLYEHATFPVRRFERLFPDVSLCDFVQQGRLPKVYCESKDPDRQVPIVWSPDDFMITVSGDPDRDNCFICGNNGFIGYPTSRKVELPARWQELLQGTKRSG